MKNELEIFIDLWERETAKTIKLLDALPGDRYDFRPDPDARSLGEMAWHLAEVEGYGTFGVERGALAPEPKPPGIVRPRSVPELSPGFERVHRDAVARVQKLQPVDLDRSVTMFTGQTVRVRDVLWDFMLLHEIHHRGQLVVLCRAAGGVPPLLYGPTRETLPLRKSTG